MERPFSRVRVIVVGALAAALVLTGLAPASADTDDLPVFVDGGVIIDDANAIYNPTGEFIFPSIFHAGEYFDSPLGEWYLYYAPHNSPGGISLAYADSLEGPWTEYAANPLITNNWAPYYSSGVTSHVSSPDAIWNPAENAMFLFFHGDNYITRYATTTDGVTFTYGGTAFTTATAGPGTTETSYARVFAHPDPASTYDWALFYMQVQNGVYSIRVAESTDMRTWVLRPTSLISAGPGVGDAVSSGNLWIWEGETYLIYNTAPDGNFVRKIGTDLATLGPPEPLFRLPGSTSGAGRVAGFEIVQDGDETYLFYENGQRLNARIAWAKVDPSLQRADKRIIDNADAAVTYTGTWTHGTDAGYYASTKAVSNVGNSTANFSFSGVALEIFARTIPNGGKFDVYIDGALAGSADTYDPVGAYQVEVFQATGLSAGTHTVQLKLNGKNASSTGYWVGFDHARYTAVPATITDDADAAVTYLGAWTHAADTAYYAGTKSVASINNRSASLTFTGTAVSVYARTIPNGGKFNVYIDGVLAGSGDTYDPVGQYQVEVFQLTGLSSGSHTVEVRLNGQKNAASTGYFVGLDYFAHY